MACNPGCLLPLHTVADQPGSTRPHFDELDGGLRCMRPALAGGPLASIAKELI